MTREILIPIEGPFDLFASIESGQAFRWERCLGGYVGVVKGDLYFVRFRDGALEVQSPSSADPEAFAQWYFDMETDYGALCDRLRSADESVCRAVDFAPGLRLLRQEPWEVLVSFLLSQNNNIPRIKQLVARLCLKWGERRSVDNYTWFVMPTPESLATATDDELRACGVGYRARSIREAAGKLASGEVDLDALAAMNTVQAREALVRLHGVGRKVADCILLFGLRKLDAFPVDVWIKRGLEANYFEGREQRLKDLHAFTQGHFMQDAGYAQNYLFYHTRSQGAGRGRKRSTGLGREHAMSRKQ